MPKLQNILRVIASFQLVCCISLCSFLGQADLQMGDSALLYMDNISIFSFVKLILCSYLQVLAAGMLTKYNSIQCVKVTCSWKTFSNVFDYSLSTCSSVRYGWVENSVSYVCKMESCADSLQYSSLSTENWLTNAFISSRSGEPSITLRGTNKIQYTCKLKSWRSTGSGLIIFIHLLIYFFTTLYRWTDSSTTMSPRGKVGTMSMSEAAERCFSLHSPWNQGECHKPFNTCPNGDGYIWIVIINI